MDFRPANPLNTGNPTKLGEVVSDTSSESVAQPGSARSRPSVHLGILAILLCAVWILAGLFGHEPWRQDEAYTFGMVYHILNTGDLVVPTLAGEPFMEKPPFFFYTAALFGKLLSPPLSLPDATRLATGFFTTLTALFLYLAARNGFGASRAWIAPLALLGSIGLLKYGHLMITDNALLTAFALMLFSWSLFHRRPGWAGLAGGCALGLGLMTKGLIGPGIMAITTILLPVLFRSWRKREMVRYILIMAAVALPWAVAWPTALYLRSRELFIDWFWCNNFGRFFGMHYDVRKQYFQTDYIYFLILWGGLPVAHLAAWAIWKERRGLRDRPELQAPLVCFVVAFLVLSTASNTRELYALPMLACLAIPAALAGAHIPERWALRINRAIAIVFGAGGALLWLGWVVLTTGRPAALARRLLNPAPEYAPRVVAIAVLGAIAASVLWAVVQRMLEKRNGMHIILNWTAGVTLCWALASTLWMPWMDSARNYRNMLGTMKPHLPPPGTEISRINIGEPLRALIHYYSGICTRPVKDPSEVSGDWLLIEFDQGKDVPEPDASWTPVWEGRHKEKRLEIFRLYRRAEAQEREANP